MSGIDLKKCYVAPSGNIITCQGRLSYAQFLINPQTNKFGKTKYNVSLVVPADSDLTELKNAMGKIALDKVDGDKTRAKKLVEKRFLDPNDLPQGGKPMGEEFDGWILLRGSSDNKPTFAYPNGQQIPDEKIADELYSGRWARVTFNPYWSANKENPGVFLGLQNVQLLGHDENLGVRFAKADEEFGAVEGVEPADYDTGESSQGGEKKTSSVEDLF